MRTLSSNLVKALPLCCLFLAAGAEDDCTIRIVGEGEGEEGEGEEGEGEEGEGEEGECESDADCRDGQFCELFSDCPPCVNEEPACEVACFVGGKCVDLQPDVCAGVDCGPDFFCVDGGGFPECLPINSGNCGSDFDCGRGEFCDFSSCFDDGSGGGAAPCDPNSPDGSCDSDIACAGVCRPFDVPSCLNTDCGPGFHCVEGDFGAQCVPDGSQCIEDADCGPGAHCEVFCGSDPSCPECDVCIMEGQCVQDECPALCGPGQVCVINADGTVSCETIVEPNCTSDADCNGGICSTSAGDCQTDPSCFAGENCVDVCFGFCSDPNINQCFADEDCADGEVCVTETICPDCTQGDPACAVPCRVDGKCVPQEPPPPPPQP